MIEPRSKPAALTEHACVHGCLMRPCALHRSLQMPSKCACGCGQRVGRLGNYLKGCAKALGVSCDASGKQKAENDKYNPINGPIKRLKRKIELRADAEAYLIEHGRTGILSDKLRMEIVMRIATDRSLFDGHIDKRLHGKSLDDLFNDPTFTLPPWIATR